MEHLYDEEDDHLSLRKSSNPYDKLLRKLRKSLIASFNTHSKQSKNFKMNIILSLSLSFISMMQGISLVLRRYDDIAEYSALEKIFAMVNYTRLDTLAFDLGLINEFFYAMMVTVYTPVGILAANVVLNVYWKKKPNWLSVKIMAFVLNLLEQILLLPALVLMISSIKYSYLSHEQSMFEYGDSSDLIQSHGLSAASFITIPVLVFFLYVNSYFFYDNIYAKRKKLVYSMRDSFVHRVHILARFGMVLCYCFLSSLSKVWYRIGILMLCVIMYLLYTNRLSYFNTILNVENASKKAVIVWSVIAYFVGWGSDSASAIVIMLVFVTPVLISLIYFYTVERTRISGKIRNREIISEFQVELKLRSYFEDLEQTKKEDQDSICFNIEQLFNFATQQFSKSPLLPIWEALYYYHYRKDLFLALLKLSKGHVCEPTLESQFFSNKIEVKFLSVEKSPERMYLRYLKLLDEAKRSDESCCLQLLAVCTELLSRKIDSKKVDMCVERLSKEMKRTTDRYFRILELYNDNEEVLQLLGSFTYDIMKEVEGKTFISRASMLKNNDLRRGATSTGMISSSLFNDINGLIVLSCCIQTQGEIILSNSKAYELFKCSKMDLLHKPFTNFLPDEYRKIFSQSLNQLVLFGLHLNCIHHLFRLMLDADGFLISTSVTMKITTWDNKPHIMLMLTPNETSERVLVDAAYKVRGHTRLEISGRELSTMYIGCSLEEVFPDLMERLATEERAFMFRSGAEARLVTVETIEFREVMFRLISFQHLFLSHRSTTQSGVSSQRMSSVKESRKGVRFNSEEAQGQIDQKRETPVQPSHEANTTIMLSEAEVRMKRKYEITTSLTTTTSTTVSFEKQENLKTSRSLNRVKLFLVLSLLMLVTGLVASVIFVSDILESLKSITTIKDYSERNLEIVDIAYHARSLILSDSPLFPYDQQSVISKIQGTTINLGKLTDFMKSLVGKGSREADAYLTEHKVPMWLKLENSYQFHKMTMLDALYTYVTAATQLSSSASPYAPISDSYYVFRNGVSDLLQVANFTLHMRVKNEQKSREENLKVIEYLIYMCGMLISLPLLLLVWPQFFLFEKQARKVWLDIYGLSREMILDMRTCTTERLQNYFSNEVVIENQMASKHTDRIATPTKLWPGFLLRICCYLAASLIFFVILEVAFFIPLNNLALTIPNYLFWMGLRAKLVTESMLWSRENQLIAHNEYTFSMVIPEGDLWFHPEERMANTTNSLSFVRRVITFGDSKYGVTSVKKSDSYLSFLFTDSCSEVSISNCENTEASLGLTFELKEWINYVNFMRYEDIPHADLFTAIQEMESKAEGVIESADYAINFYQKDAISQIDNISVQVVTISVSFIALVFLLYVLMYSPTLTRMLVRTKQALRVHRMLRSK